MSCSRRCAVATVMALLIQFGPGLRMAAAQQPYYPNGPAYTGTKAASASDASWARILDTTIPLEMRKQELTALELSAQTDDAQDLYMLGSLYHMGQRSPGSPVQEDPVKASLYLGNAAMRGSVMAMAKMAELKFAERQDREAMNWAQIYAHYLMLSPKHDKAQDGYAAALIQRILERLGQSGMPEVMRDVDSFIAANDGAIKTGMAGTALTFHLRLQHTKRSVIAPEGYFAPHAGFADYLLAFNADGSVAKAWLVDDVPNAQIGSLSRKYANEMTAAPTRNDAGDGLRYAWVPVIYNDGRYHMHGEN
jgi:hypothetical protein